MNQSPKQSANIEFKLCPPSLSKSSFTHSNSSVGTQKWIFRPCPPVLMPHPPWCFQRLDSRAFGASIPVPLPRGNMVPPCWVRAGYGTERLDSGFWANQSDRHGWLQCIYLHTMPGAWWLKLIQPTIRPTRRITVSDIHIQFCIQCTWVIY